MEATYTDDGHMQEIAKNLNEMREEKDLCDVVLQTKDGGRLQAHRNVLAAASPYFRAMFCGAFKESKASEQSPIILHEITFIGLKTVVDFIYSGSLTLQGDVVFEVLPVAHMMQLSAVVQYCEDFLIQGMNAEQCFRSLEMAEKYSLEKLELAAEKFVLDNFAGVSKCEKFQEMPVEVLCRFLTKERLKGPEIEIFRAIKQWMEFSEDRQQHLLEVMKHVNFKVIPITLLVDEVLQVEYLKSDHACFQIICQALKYHSKENLFSQPLEDSGPHRGEETVIMVGTNEQDQTTLITCKKSDLTDCDNVGEINCQTESFSIELEVEHVNLVTVGNFMFVLGRDFDSQDQFFKRFDGTSKVWMDLAPMPAEYRKGCITEEVHGMILVAGGCEAPSCEVRRSALCYSLASNKWKRVKAHPVGVARAASCVLNYVVYVAGGVQKKCDDERHLMTSGVYAYDPKGNLWLSKADMNYLYVEFVLEAVNNNLFVIGEYDDEQVIVENYDVDFNQWTVVHIETLVMTFHASFVHQGNIFLLGSCKSDGWFKMIFNTEENTLQKSKTVLSDRPNCGPYVILKM